MLRNLKAEMVRTGVTTEDIARTIKKTTRSARDKVNGKQEFTLLEAMAIHDTYFPGLAFEYLFEKATEEVSA